GAPAVPGPPRAAVVRARGLDVPADLDRAAAVSVAARAASDRHLPGPGLSVPDLRDAAHDLAAARVLPATAARDRGRRARRRREPAARADRDRGPARRARAGHDRGADLHLLL